MMSLYTKLSRIILENDNFKDAAHLLFAAYIKKAACEEYVIKDDVIRKLATSVQYFYLSDDELAKKEGAELLSMLLSVAPDKTPELVGIAEHIFSTAGDFPNIELLRKKFPNNTFKICLFDEIRKDLRKSLNTVHEINHPLTDYQRNLWEHLISGEDIITSAPTSTGKTHIILKFLVEKVLSSSGAFAAIVVPTRALISEVASKVYDIAKEISPENELEVCTFPKDSAFSDKTIFVMTQERLSETLQSNILNFDYLFVDEAHNIADEDRGVLLHMTLQKLLESSTPQTIISMPSERYLNAFNSVFVGTEFITRSTRHSPVAKLFIEAQLKGRNLILKRKGSTKSVTLDNTFPDNKFEQIIYRLGKNESNIIYRNRTDYCENTADQLANLIPHPKENPRLAEAADYVEKFIHKDFTLADNLKKGVAFHYGPLPGVVRRMIETLAKDNLIDFIACTSTLAEGVNLPAKNLFLKDPMQFVGIGKKYEQLEDVKLANITGRAGRMIEHFAGNIFLVEPSTWKVQDYFDIKPEKEEKISTYYKMLNDSVDNIIGILQNNHTPEEKISTHYSVANKLIREYESETISTTLQARELSISSKNKSRLLEAVQTAYENLNVPSFTLEANPTIGYLQQNKLYNFLRAEQNLSEWALPHPMSKTLYDQLVKVCSELSAVGIFLPDNYVNVVCRVAKRWVQGHPLRSIIAYRMKNNPGEKCNTAVRNIIRVINGDIRFNMASALRCYQLLLTSVIEEKKEDITSVPLHGFIEAGGCHDRMLQLVNLGLSRETAIEIHIILKKDANNVNIDSFNSLLSLYKSGALRKMHPITQKELERILL